MQATITVITLGVDDLQRALRFYRDGLGLATKGIIGQEFEHGAMVLMDLQPACAWLYGRAHRFGGEQFWPQQRDEPGPQCGQRRRG